MDNNFSRDFLLRKLKDYFLEKTDFFKIDMAFLFGSYAKGLIKDESDIDIAILFQNLDEDKIFRAVSNISYELSIMFKKDVNIVPIYLDFRKPMLYYNAIVLGTPLYIQDKNAYTRLYLEALHNMEDFNLFGRKWQLESARNNLRK